MCVRSHFGSNSSSSAHSKHTQGERLLLPAMSSTRQMSEPARASGWIPVRPNKTEVLPVDMDKTRVTYRKRPGGPAAKLGKPPAKRLHKQGPEVHAIIQAATSKEQVSPEPSESSSSSDDSPAPVVGRPSLKHQTHQAKLEALVAARDCESASGRRARRVAPSAWAGSTRSCASPTTISSGCRSKSSRSRTSEHGQSSKRVTS